MKNSTSTTTGQPEVTTTQKAIEVAGAPYIETTTTTTHNTTTETVSPDAVPTEADTTAAAIARGLGISQS